MTATSAARYKALILILLAMLFAQKFVSGKLFFYIAPRFSWLAVLSMVLLIILASAYRLVGGEPGNAHLHASDQHADNRFPLPSLLILALPLALGILVPSQPLGANAATIRGISTDLAIADDRGSIRLTLVPSRRTVLDWARAMYEKEDPGALDGQEADIVGFVYRDSRFGSDQFMVGRFAITCCIADALAIGVVASTEDAHLYTQDTWVRVRGVFQEGNLDGQPIPILDATSVERVEEPEYPYLYP